MKQKLLIIFLTLFTIQFIYAQRKKVPKNLKQALAILHSDCSDSLKLIIAKTSDDKLINLCYPWSENTINSYKTIYVWLVNNNEGIKISKYLNDKGVKTNQYQQTVILIAFKEKLLRQDINEERILKPYQDIESKWNEEDKIRLTTDSLRGVYIPKDIQECFKQLNTFFNDSTKEKVKSLKEDEFTGRYHLGFGTWLRNSWGLWGGSRLSNYFDEMGIYNAEDMSGIILSSYHRYLLGNPIKLDEQIRFYKDYWEKAKQKELENKKVEFGQFKISDTVEYKYNYGYISKKQEDDFDRDSCISKGAVIAKDESKFYLKIKIIETCDKKGIITYDSKDSYVYNKELK